MTENRKILNTADLDGFDKRKLPSPGFQVEIVLTDYNGSVSPRPSRPAPNNETDQAPTAIIAPAEESKISHPTKTNIETRNKDDVFSDSEGDEGGSTEGKRSPASNHSATVNVVATEGSETEPRPNSGLPNISHRIDQISLKAKDATIPAVQAVQEQRTEENKSPAFQASELESTSTSEFKAIAADASVFSFGDEDYESE